jgi:HlyD family secretion protein
MTRNENVLNVLMLTAVAAVAIGYFAPRYFAAPPTVGAAAGGTAVAAGPVAAQQPGQPAPTASAATTAKPAGSWAAAAPGKVEPNGGEVRLTAQAPGRIVEVLAAVNDRVIAGDLLARMDDGDAEIRVTAAESEASVRKRERDAEAATGLARDRRTAEDAVAEAERLLASNRATFDQWLRARKAGTAPPAELQKARETVTAAKDRLDQAKANLRRILATNNLPAQTRLEAAVTAARADLSLADAALERTRIRATRDATILQVAAVGGEMAAPSAEQVLMVLGDLSKLRVRAEIEERDVAKIKPGQGVVVRADAFPGQSFEGKIATIAQTLAPGKVPLKGPRRGTEVDTLEVMVDLDGAPPLLPGMRVDVLVKP